MPRKQYNDGQEIIYQDLSIDSAVLELELYDRVIMEVMNRQKDFVFKDGFFVSYVNGTSVSVKAGQGIQFDGTKVDPEPKNRLLYLPTDTLKNLTTPDSTRPRIDLVCIRNARAVTATETRNEKDAVTGAITSVSMDVETDWRADIQIVAGTPNASPVAPAVPSGYIKVASLLVSASTGVANQSAITDTRVRYKNQSGSEKVTTITANYTADLDDDLILANASGGNILVTLPPVAKAYDSPTGLAKKYTVINIGATGTVTVQGDNGGEPVSDATTQAMTSQFSALSMVCNAIQWYLVS